MLVCVTVNEQNNLTRLGAIRSIKSLSGDEIHIGVEVLSDAAIRVETKYMRLPTNRTTANLGSLNLNLPDIALNFNSIFLPPDHDKSIDETLVIHKAQYNKNEVYKIRLLGKDEIIRPIKVLDYSEDWVRVSFSRG